MNEATMWMYGTLLVSILLGGVSAYAFVTWQRLALHKELLEHETARSRMQQEHDRKTKDHYARQFRYHRDRAQDVFIALAQIGDIVDEALAESGEGERTDG